MEASDECGTFGIEGVQQLLWVNGLIAQEIPDNRVGIDTQSYSLYALSAVRRLARYFWMRRRP
jgi:hypothetical protein